MITIIVDQAVLLLNQNHRKVKCVEIPGGVESLSRNVILNNI